MRLTLLPLLALCACGESVVTGFEAEIVTIADSPFGLTQDDRLEIVSGEFSWHTANLDADGDDNLGEFNHPGDGNFSITLPDGVEVTGSGYSQVKLVGTTTINIFDGSDTSTLAQAMLVDDEIREDVQLAMLLVHDGNLWEDSSVLPNIFPDTNPDNWTHTFSLKDINGTILFQLTSLTDRSPDQ